MKKNTIRAHIQGLFHRSTPRTVLQWPPDIFAVAASLLSASGAYSATVGNLMSGSGNAKMPQKLARLGNQWRKAVIAKKAVPNTILKNWRTLMRCSKAKLDRISANPKILTVLLDLLGAADEACKELVSPNPSENDDFHTRAWALMVEHPESLCLNIAPHLARVLPKIHTPQVGMTLRSLSHHLAFCESKEVTAQWFPMKTDLSTANKKDSLANLLIFPIPIKRNSACFEPKATRISGRAVLQDDFGFFTYRPQSALKWLNGKFKSTLHALKNEGREIHGVVFPEGSLPTRKEFQHAYEILSDHYPQAFFLAGVSTQGKTDRHPGENYLLYAVPIDGVDGACLFRQSKHHRWKLDKPQIQRYKLTSLDPDRTWWEHIDISNREITFFSAKSWLTYCFLICEDLARQEPVAPLVRAIGPHLVIALLQDGPQLKKRWPNRYAGVLADDPGAAVLTVTSLGMIKNCSKDSKRKVSIGLWSEPGGPKRGARTIELKFPKKAAALLLQLRSERTTEFSTDGRQNNQASALLLKKKLTIF